MKSLAFIVKLVMNHRGSLSDILYFVP